MSDAVALAPHRPTLLPEQAAAPSPRLERPITLHFMGDWGQFNLTRVCGWLAQEVGDRSPPGTRSAIWTGRGGTDTVRAVARGEVQVGVATPAQFVQLALDGRGPYGGEAFPRLRALGTVLQTDRLVLAVRADLGIRTFADLRDRRVPLRIATCPDDGVNHIGFALQRIMEAAGIPRATLEAWGGAYLEDERPFPCLQWVADGRADAVFQEAIMTPDCQTLAATTDLAFIPLEDAVLAEVGRRLGWQRATLPAGYMRGLDAPLAVLDFSDFLGRVQE